MTLILYDETEPIKHVFVHEPGLECKIALESEDPGMWLFDSSLKGGNSSEWIKEAKKEHLGYVELLKKQGTKVHYLVSLLKGQESTLKEKLEGALNSAIASKLISNEAANDFWKEILSDTVTAALKGVNIGYDDYKKLMEAGLSILIPKPNAYFAQDPFAIMGDCFVELKPATWQRSGEPELWEMALQPLYEKSYQMQNISEGGDITIFNEKALVGIGTRTTEEAAKEIYALKEKLNYINNILAVYKPDANKKIGMPHSTDFTFIHLDTIWMPSYDKSIGIGNKNLINGCNITNMGNGHNSATLDVFLSTYDHMIIHSNEEEQYSLAPNVLPLNGVMICADVNKKTNRAMVNAGLNVETFAAEALLMGCGSGHCMSNAVNYLVQK